MIYKAEETILMSNALCLSRMPHTTPAICRHKEELGSSLAMVTLGYAAAFPSSPPTHLFLQHW